MHMNDTVKDILRRVDHTLLSQGATWEEIRAICDDGVKYGCFPKWHKHQRISKYMPSNLPAPDVECFPRGSKTGRPGDDD